jgi:hypothetical protein
MWCYGLVYLDNVCAQGHLYGLYEGTLGKYWDERRKLIDQLVSFCPPSPLPPFFPRLLVCSQAMRLSTA